MPPRRAESFNPTKMTTKQTAKKVILNYNPTYKTSSWESVLIEISS
jgi:hypothetical protein